MDSRTLFADCVRHRGLATESCFHRLYSEHGKGELYDGIICSYNGMTRKYGVYFPCDGETIDTDLEDKDMEICN